MSTLFLSLNQLICRFIGLLCQFATDREHNLPYFWSPNLADCGVNVGLVRVVLAWIYILILCPPLVTVLH